MVTSHEALMRYGDPNREAAMTLFNNTVGGKIPPRIYCNKDLVKPLSVAFELIKSRGLLDQITEWNGCFCIRQKRGSASTSLHSWGLAIDINASTNKFGKPPNMSQELVKAFKDAGFDWGGSWKKPDGMHFQLARLP